MILPQVAAELKTYMLDNHRMHKKNGQIDWSFGLTCLVGNWGKTHPFQDQNRLRSYSHIRGSHYNRQKGHNGLF